jgi:hypothetical protein
MSDNGRLWRTDKGDLVGDGHPDARVLAYGVSDEPTDEDAKSIRKQAPKPANKQAPKAADKQAPAPRKK